jgi:hypothetical protein
MLLTLKMNFCSGGRASFPTGTVYLLYFFQINFQKDTKAFRSLHESKAVCFLSRAQKIKSHHHWWPKIFTSSRGSLPSECMIGKRRSLTPTWQYGKLVVFWRYLATLRNFGATRAYYPLMYLSNNWSYWINTSILWLDLATPRAF